LEEILNLSTELDGVAPCIDFAHRHAQTGKFNSYPEFASILGTAVSICGVSAAIAAGGAVKGDPKKRRVSHTISLVLLCAIPMLIAPGRQMVKRSSLRVSVRSTATWE
jgi:uncharacterized membrane protein YadS